MPLPPILEVFVVWHPDDADLGQKTADTLTSHFHSPTFSGLAGGAVEVYTRSEGWEREFGAPRPLGFMEPWPHGLPSAEFTAVVPILGTGLARAYDDDEGWREYIDAVLENNGKSGVGVYPVRDPDADISNSRMASAVGSVQTLHEKSATEGSTLCRDLSQAIAQNISRRSGTLTPIKVFVSHTKHHSPDELDTDGEVLFEKVRQILRSTHLDEFFDASDLQPGHRWEEVLISEAGRCALLMVRTDKYAGREWTQREVLIAKNHDLPIVVLYALRSGEERGSFLMDHLPALPCNLDDPEPDIIKALNRIVEESLKRELWLAQTVYMTEHGFDWLPVHAPEPVTAGGWLRLHQVEQPEDDHVWIVHPDPPLGSSERELVVELCALAGYTEQVEIFTPRTFAARGGRLPS